MIKKYEFSSSQITQMLPHKFPFCMVDRAFDIIPGKSGYGVKGVTFNEWFFQGHFPGEPIMPGVITIESLAQLSAIIYISEYLDDNDLSKHASKVGYLGKIDMKFYATVKPGSMLELYSENVRKMGSLFQFKVKAKVNKKIIADGNINVSSRDV